MFRKENKAGLYLTIAVHLMVIIVLLSAKIGFVLSEETSFVLDFTKQEESEKEEQKARFEKEISNELDEILSGQDRNRYIRNVATDVSSLKGSQLKDDRFTNPKQVYDEAKRLQEKLDASRRETESLQGSDENISSEEKKDNKGNTYKGPSVISYSLEGRKALSLPIPVYKCVGGGDVYVAISVNRKGYVIAASVITASSSSDKCLQEFAVKAARSSRFTASSTAPEKQAGEIVYRFIAQ
jgi:hypothetical protein